MRWDGTALRAVPIPDTPTAVGVWGTSDDDVWVSSPIGQVARWDGRAWQRFALPTEATIRWIGGRGPNDVWAADDQSASFHWDGRRWTAVSAFAAAGDRSDRRAGAVRTGALFRLAAARDRSRLFAFASDGSVVARDEWGDWGGRGPSWRTILPVRPARIFPQAPALSFVPDDLWIAGRDDVWAIGSYSGEPVMMRWEGAAWNTADDADGRRAMAREDIVAVYTDGDDVWAASTRRLGNARGHQGQLRRRRGERWTSVTTLARFPTALFGLGASDIWAAGVAGAMWHWDGARWHDVPTGTDDDLLALWGSRPDDVWAGGIDGALLRWDGRGWRRWQVPAAPNIGARSQRAAADTNVRSLAGSAGDDVWAVSGTELLHFDGRSWSRVPAPAAVDAVWAAGRNDLWVATHESRAALDRTARTPVGAGEDGDAIAGIFRWDGLVWEQSKREHPMLWRGRLVGIRGRDSGEIWAWGTHGLFEHYDGRRWSTVSAHIGTRAVLDVALGTGGAVWLAGTDELCHRHR
jgi:hypothetical protein